MQPPTGRRWAGLRFSSVAGAPPDRLSTRVDAPKGSRKSRFGDYANRGSTARSALEPELFDKPLSLAGTLGVVRLRP
jgi:hypothetical protein